MSLLMQIQDRCPVHLAVALGHVDVVASLIKFGCSVLEKVVLVEQIRLRMLNVGKSHVL